MTGHKYYGVKRRKTFVHSIDDIVYNENRNYQTYNRKILAIVKSKNINQLTTQLLVNPNLVFSFIEKNQFSHQPLLYFVLQTGNSKLISLFWDCLFHFGEIILNQKLDCNATNLNTNHIFVFIQKFA